MTDDTPLDPAASARLVTTQRAKVLAATDVDRRLIFGVWGVAWLVGFGLLWAVTVDPPLVNVSQGAGLLVFFALLVAAMVVTAVHLAKKSAGMRGATAVQGAMFGSGWFLGCGLSGTLGYVLNRGGASGELMTTVMMAVNLLVVGLMYIAGGAIWKDRTQFFLGAWILVVTAVAVVIADPYMMLVMSLAGGGGMLVGAAVEMALRRRPTAL